MVRRVNKIWSVIRVVFILLLLCLFLYTVASPNIARFLAGGVMLEVTTLPMPLDRRPQFEKVPPPTVTFCPRQNVSAGWKVPFVPANKSAFIAEFCSLNTSEDVSKCIKEKTFSLNDTIKYSIHDLKTKTDTKNESLWNSSLTTVFLGYCHSFTFSKKLKADMITDALVFGLDGALDYRVILHDPHYYHFVSNPMVFPRLWREYRGSDMVGRFEWFYISLTQHEKMDRDGGPCEEREEYSFVHCVKTSQASQVGCRPPWDVWSPSHLPLCSNTAQLRQHEELDWNNFNYEQKIIINNTGCLPPCKYKEYKLVGEPQSGFVSNLLGNISTKVDFAFGMNFVSTDIRMEKEVEIYPLISFISELGGSLGLFLGFSFMTIWDLIDYFILRYDSIKLFG